MDTTKQKYKRQKELKERYFFDCTCLRCESSADPKIPAEMQAAARRAMLTGRPQLVDPHLDDQNPQSLRSTQGSTRMDLKSLIEAQKLLDRANYPSQVYQARQNIDDIVLKAIGAREWLLATKFALRRSMDVDPLTAPQPWHPVRVVNYWVLLKLIILLASTHPASSPSHPEEQLQEPSPDISEVHKHPDANRIQYQRLCPMMYCCLRTNAEKSHGGQSRFVEKLEEWAKETGLLVEWKSILGSSDVLDDATVREDLTILRRVVESVVSSSSGGNR